MSLLTGLALWVALSFLLTPPIGAFIYRQTRYRDAGRGQASTFSQSLGTGVAVVQSAQMHVRRLEAAVRFSRRMQRPLGTPAKITRPLLH